MPDIIRQYNKMAGDSKSMIQKSLTAASGSGGYLIPEKLTQTITDALPRLSPLVAMMTPEFDNQNYHQFNRLSTLPAAGGAMGESATTPTTQPIFTRDGVYLKIVRRKGATTNFLQDASKRNVDSAALNIEACLLSHVYDLENYTMYGNAPSNTYEYNGFDYFVQTNRTNQAVGGAVPTSLKFLDDMLDANLDLKGEGHRKAFIMSPYMLSKVSQLQSQVRLNMNASGAGAMSVVDLPGGWRVNAYRDVPIIMSSACRPKAACSLPVATSGTTLGTIANGAVSYIRLAAVTRDGETLSCAEVTCTAATSAGTNTIILTFTAVAGAYKYKVYAGSVSGTLTLSRIVPAFTYDANGTPTVSDTDVIGTAGYTTVTSDANGAVTVITLFNDPYTADAATVPSALQADVPLTGALASSIPETVWMIDFDIYQGFGKLPFTNSGGSRFAGLVTIEDLAKTDDFLPFLIKSYCAVANSFEATSVLSRGWKVA